MPRIYLSAPHMSGLEREFVDEAFRSNWLTTLGPNVEGFEREFEALVGRPAVALASGTAALHLALRLAGVGPRDRVLCPTFTFVASANPVRYLGAEPVFLDSERGSWNLDPEALASALAELGGVGRPRALVVVHLFGQTADMDPILELCARHGVAVIEDAAEALGADYRGRPAGTLGDYGVYSFNGNKIITTTGGGMLVARERAAIDRARFWSQQARDPGVAYEHSELGYNYRMSNVLAGIGRGQLRVLADRVAARRAIAFRYRDALADLGGLELMPQAPWGLHTNWLSCFLVDEPALGCTRDALIQALAAEEIEARPVWKPMHLQPLYAGARRFGGAVAEDLFARGICLPSSSSLTESDQARVVAALRGAVARARGAAA
ncbi:MAG: aminotransferase class I/II-fold pyridoxal phosphate-dependent enzyme [Deltaproteobacteria bacterium]|nr:aminotransferase class I/II-fold pyridoxal phosphate-dependent enzyme [Deltaproteobacteria bacterium]